MLQRLSIGLSLDNSLAEQRAELENLVKATVGFDQRRSDQLVSAVVTMRRPVDAVDGEGAVAGEPAADSGVKGALVEEVEEPGLSPMMELLITRGVEIASALAFIVLLALSLRGMRAPKAGAAAGSAGDPTLDAEGNAIDPEVLALAQVQELLRNDPDRVISILSNWAREEHSAART